MPRLARFNWIAGLCLLGAAPSAVFGTDYNGDGLCDVWQQQYDAWELSAGGDEDLDGCSNLAESIAGTNPRDPADCVRVGDVLTAAGNVVVTVETQKGKRYQLQSSNGPTGPVWVNEGAPVIGTGLARQFVTPMGGAGARKFYRVRTDDVDSDSDGVSDWAEEVVGTNPALANSPNNASGGAASDGDTLASVMSLTVEVETANGYERVDKKAANPAPAPARLRLVRGVGTMPLTLPVQTEGGAPELTKSSASAADHAALTSVTIPAGQGTPGSPFLMPVNPVADAVEEVPEYLRVRVGNRAGAPSATVCICDADPALEGNRTLFVAFLGREEGVNTTATGIATALVAGDNNSATISLTFSNLTSPQNTAYLRYSNDDLVNIGQGQVSGRGWAIRAASTKITDQAMLKALHDGELYVSITTADNPSGEIRGYFGRATGSTTFTYNPQVHDAPDVGGANWSEPEGSALERDIWRFLDQSTYGGTQALYDEVLAEVNAAVAGGGNYLDGYEAWLDKQMNPAVTPNANLMELVIAADNEEWLLRGNKPLTAGNDPQFAGVSYGVTHDAFGNVTAISTTANGTYNNNHPFHNNRRREMWTLAMGAKAQVRQRMAQALSEILVISEMDQTVQDRHYGAANYWDMLADNAFGSYRNLLEKVTYHPMMGIYLSHLRNRATYVSGGVTISPDENYAREIMQLFSIGLVLRHPDGSLVLDSAGLPVATYDNTDIAELARVLTGLCHGARHATANVLRFNGISMTASNSQRVSPTIEIQGSQFTSFTEGAGDRWFQAPWIYPMKMLGRVGTTVYHDFGAKTLLAGKHGETVIPARNIASSTDAQTHALGDADLTLAHNMLAGAPGAGVYNGHQNTPVNVSRWLIQRLVTSNPSAGYLYRVSEVYRQSNGNLGDVLKAILLDYEARSLEHADTSISHGRMKEPMVHFMAVMRGLKARSGAPLTALRDMSLPFAATDSMRNTPYPAAEVAKFEPGASRFRFPDQTGTLGQSPLRAPSVFNWFLPDYTVPGALAEAGLFAPEMQLATETGVVNRVNRLWTFTWMNLDGMAVYPGVDVDDFPQVASNAAVQVKVHSSATPLTSFTTTRTLTFTPSNWSTAQAVHVAAVDDLAREGPHTTRIRHTATSTDPAFNAQPMPEVTVTINDNEGGNGRVLITETGGVTIASEGGPGDTYEVRLSKQPTAPVTVRLAPNSAVGVSPATLEFSTTNWNTNQTVTVTAVDDGFGGETTHFGTVGHVVATADTTFAGVPGPSVTVYVGDNDSAGSNGITLRATGGTTVVTEAGATDVYTVALNRAPTDTVTVTVGTNARVTTSPGTLTFTTANWWVPQVVAITAVNDTTANGTESFNLAHTSSGGGYSSSATLPVTVNDNDGSATGSLVLVQSSGTTVVTEGSTTDSYTVALSRAPTATVTISVAPEMHARPMADHAKLQGYFSSDAPQSNDQKDRVIFDYSDLIAIYNSVYAASPGISLGANSTNAQRQAAHFAATVAVVDKLDLMWCGGQLKRQFPVIAAGDINNRNLVHPRKSIIGATYHAYSTTRVNAGADAASYGSEVRRRVQIAAYLTSLTPQSFVSK